MKQFGFLVALMNTALWAQSTAAPPSVFPQADTGLESPDEARAIVAALLKEDGQLRPLLTSLNPQGWYEKKGAPSSYVIQWQAAQRQLSVLEVAAKLFLQHLDRLAPAMDLYFRMEALETTARALNEGAQRYAEQPQAEQLASFVARNFDSRQRFRDYVKDLASNMEQNYKIADEEAQRCRAIVSQQSAAPCSGTAPRKSRKN